MELTILFVLTTLVIVSILLIIFKKNRSTDDFYSLAETVNELKASLGRIETGLKDDFRINREENAAIAKDIREKYVDPPETTDFGIMFLPFEGIYAEIMRRSHLLETLQREYNIVVTGPTTLAVILNSLQMGFRTLALQKRSSEVWQILGAVKNEFGKFGGLLEKAKKNIDTAGNTIDDLMGTRTRAINRKLKDVQSLPSVESNKIIPEIAGTEILDNEEE